MSTPPSDGLSMSRSDAMDKARAVFGPDVELEIEVVRSGGIGGFFATERYRAVPVDPTIAAPVVPVEAPIAVTDLHSAINEAAEVLGIHGGEPAAPVGGGATYRGALQRPVGTVPVPQDESDDDGAAAEAMFRSASAGDSIPFGRKVPVEETVVEADHGTVAEEKPRRGVVIPPVGATSSFAAALAQMQAAPAVISAIEDLVVDTAEPTGSAVSAPQGDPVPEAASGATGPLDGVSVAVGGPVGHGVVKDVAGLGFNEADLGAMFIDDVTERGLHWALDRVVRTKAAPAPAVPSTAGLIVVLGVGIEPLTTAQNLAVTLDVTPAQIGWSGPAQYAALVPLARRVQSHAEATEWSRRPKRSNQSSIVAVSVSMTEGMSVHVRDMVEALKPSMVIASVDASRKVDDVNRWLKTLPSVDAVSLENIAATADPAYNLMKMAAPVLFMEGRKATANRWATMLVERVGEGEQ